MNVFNNDKPGKVTGVEKFWKWSGSVEGVHIILTANALCIAMEYGMSHIAL